MNHLLREGLYTMGRIGVRAMAKAAESILEDVGAVADNVSHKTRKVKNGLGKFPRERRGDDDADR